MKRREIACFLVCFIVLFTAVAFGQDYVGTLNNAPYKIRVPANWNGTLLMYAHGYGYLERWNPATQFNYSYADPAPGMPFPTGPNSVIFMEDVLLSQGYALAGTVFSGAGWQVKEGTHELVSLAGLFNGLVGKPQRTILIGYSMGSLIALKSAEEVPIYDGVIAGCAVGAGTTKAFELVEMFALAYHTLFGWPEDWGTWYDVRDDLKFYAEVYPVFLSQFGDPANVPKFEFIRLLLDAPVEGFYSQPYWPALHMFFATEGRAELEGRAKGPVSQNADHYYTMTLAEKAYLSSIGINADMVLSDMNSQTTVTIAPQQKQYLQKYFDLSGDIQRPVISMHELGDGLVGVYNESVMLTSINAAGKAGLFLQVYTNGAMHCYFTPSQLLRAVGAMESWIATGVKPGGDFFPATDGFVPGYTPPAWPIGSK